MPGLTVIGTILCSTALNLPMLYLGRALEGFAASIIPLAAGIMRDRLPPTGANRAIAAFVGGATVGGVIGSLLTSLVYGTTHNIRITLLIPVIFFLIAFLAVLVFVPETQQRAARHVDWPVVILFTAASTVVLLAASAVQKLGWWSLAALALVIALTVWWWRVERRQTEPFIEVREVTSKRMGPYFIVGFLAGGSSRYCSHCSPWAGQPRPASAATASSGASAPRLQYSRSACSRWPIGRTPARPKKQQRLHRNKRWCSSEGAARIQRTAIGAHRREESFQPSGVRRKVSWSSPTANGTVVGSWPVGAK